MENKNENKNNGIAELIFRVCAGITILFAGWAFVYTWGSLEKTWAIVMGLIFTYAGIYFIMTR